LKGGQVPRASNQSIHQTARSAAALDAVSLGGPLVMQVVMFSSILEGDFYLLSELRAQHSVEQNPSFFHLNELDHLLRRGITMVKHVLNKVGVTTALATIGWLSFFVSFLINDLTCVVLLQTIARVLP